MHARPIALAALVLCCAGLIVLAGLERFPGLHLDEARFGLQATGAFAGGLDSPHGMTSYSGPFEAHLVAWSFGRLGTGVRALRLPGAALSLAAALILTLFLAGRCGERAAVLFPALLASSLLFLWKARVASETGGIQTLLLTLALVAAHGLVRGRRTAGWALLLAWAVWAGVVNHFIFLTVPLSLCAAGVLAVFVIGDRRFAELLHSATVVLALSAGLAVVKLLLTDAAWRAHWIGLGLLFAVAPFAGVALGRLARRPIDALTARVVRATGLGGRGGWRLLVFGLVVFALAHLAAFAGSWCGVLLFERMASWAPPLGLSVCLYALVGLLAAPAAARIVRLLRDRSAFAAAAPMMALMAAWLPAYLACFPILVHTMSIRYYQMPFWLTAVTVAVSAADAPAAQWRRVVAVVACLGVLVVPLALREMWRDENRRPFGFRCGWMIERSEHFMRLDPLARRQAAERPCRIEGDDFLVTPLVFLGKAAGRGCDPSGRAVVRYCPECSGPPYLTWSR